MVQQSDPEHYTDLHAAEASATVAIPSSLY